MSRVVILAAFAFLRIRALLLPHTANYKVTVPQFQLNTGHYGEEHLIPWTCQTTRYKEGIPTSPSVLSLFLRAVTVQVLALGKKR